MEVCFVTIDFHSHEGGGGLGSYIHTIGMELVRQGHGVTVVCGRRAGEPEHERSGGLRIHRVPLGNSHYYLSKLPLLRRSFVLPLREMEWSFALWNAVRRLSTQGRIDIVEAGETGNLFSALFRPNCPVVIRAHGSTYSFKKFSGQRLRMSERIDRRLELLSMRRAEGLSAPSRFQAAAIEDELAGLRRVAVIPNPVAPLFLQSEIGEIDRRQRTIVYAGRMDRSKGVLELIRAMKVVVSRQPAARLRIVGAPHVSLPVETIHKTISELQLQPNVELLGHTEWDRLADIYADSDLFATASYFETFCISAAEAMALAKPVVATRAGGILSLVDDGITGFLVPTGDYHALGGAILRLLDDAALAKRMGLAGREKVLRELNPQRVVRDTLSYYDSITSQTWRKEPSADRYPR